MGDLSVSIDFV